MRQTKIFCFYSLFLALFISFHFSNSKAIADIILHTKLLPSNAIIKILGENELSKDILLVHILNFTDTPLVSGSYEIIIEKADIENSNKNTKLYNKKASIFSYKPKFNIKPGEIKTLKLNLTSKLDSNFINYDSNNFNVYLKSGSIKVLASKGNIINDQTIANKQNSLSVLYTEAPIEDYSNITPPNEIKFEDEFENISNQIEFKNISQKQQNTLDSKNSFQNTKSPNIQLTDTKNKSEKLQIHGKNKENKDNKLKAKGNELAKSHDLNLTSNYSNSSSYKIIANNSSSNQINIKNNLSSNISTNTTNSNYQKHTSDSKFNSLPSLQTNNKNNQEISLKQPRKIKPSEFKSLRTIDEELIIYVLKEGDTIKDIATSYYGSPNYEGRIKELNFIENESTVRVGEEIIVDVKPINKQSSSTNYPNSSTISKSTNKM